MSKELKMVTRSVRPVVKFNRKRPAKQNFKEQCDVNKIVEVFLRTGKLISSNSRQPRYGDFSQGLDFRLAMNAGLLAERYYQSLPSEIRTICPDLQSFKEWAVTDEGRKVLREFNLIPKEPVAPGPPPSQPVVEPVVSPGAPAPKGAPGAPANPAP